MVYKIFDKKSVGSGIKSISNQELADELDKTVIKNFKRCKVYFSFKDNIWGADLADMELTIEYKGTKELGFYYVLLIFSVNMHGLLL